MTNQRLFDIPIHEFGNEYEITGFVLQNSHRMLHVMLPNATEQAFVKTVKPSLDDLETLMHQLDVCDVMLYPNDNTKLIKPIVRKTQRIIEQSVIWNVFRRDGYQCQYCAANAVPLTVDHVICWEDLGSSHEKNLLTACRKCNKTRGNMEFVRWLSTPYLESKMLNFFDPSDQLRKLSEFHATAISIPRRPVQRSR